MDEMVQLGNQELFMKRVYVVSSRRMSLLVTIPWRPGGFRLS